MAHLHLRLCGSPQVELKYFLCATAIAQCEQVNGTAGDCKPVPPVARLGGSALALPQAGGYVPLVYGRF